MDELLNNAPCGFLAFSDDGRVIEVNATLLDLLGYERDELVQLHVEKIFSLAGRIFYQTHFFPLLKLNGRTDEIYLDLRSRSGESIPALVNAVRRERDGRTINDCVFVAMRQRSQYEDEILRAKREAEAATRAKDEFLSVVSHELRTPLNAIIGWVQMIKNGNIDDYCRQGVEIIERSARIQSRLIEDLLDLSRIISGKLRIEVRQVELGEIISRAIEVITPAAKAKDIRLEIVLESDAFVSGDAARLQQVFWNLLSNAVKFTPKHGRVQVRLERVNSSVRVSISDTGQGIEANFLPYVFERFRQADNSGAEREGGLGLGMAITRNIVELHGGTIKAESPGEDLGTTFTVSLPVTIVHQKEIPTIQKAEHPTGENAFSGNGLSIEGLRVLVVDDDEDGRYLLTTILSLYGATAVAAKSVAEAVEKIHSEEPDLVISDIEMPGENGFSLIKKLNAINKNGTRKIPAVALTGHVGQNERLKVLKAGYQVHLAKPIEPEELIVVIANLANWNGIR
jgi:PAS domain S-box-containing protein